MPQCPRCNSTQRRKSRKQLPADLDGRRFAAAYRCEECGERYIARDTAAIGWRGMAGALLAVVVVGAATLLPDGVPEGESQREPTGTPPGDKGNGLTSAFADYAGSDDILALTRGAERGDLQSQFELAMALHRVYRRTDDIDSQLESLRWLRASATAGHPPSQTELATRYLSGQGVVQDFAEAAAWFRRAAEQGSAEAMYGLGNMARFGRAPGVDLLEAYAWLNVAAARGERRARQARRDLLSRLTDADLQKAQQLSRELDRRTAPPQAS